MQGQSYGDNITLEDLREYWLPVSPMAYMEKLGSLPERPQRYIYTKYDLSFPIDLSLDAFAATISNTAKSRPPAAITPSGKSRGCPSTAIRSSPIYESPKIGCG
jgi:hypothetical protein